MSNGELPDGWDKDIPTFPADAKGLATRDSNSKVLNAVAKNVPWLLGGAADLYPSTNTLIDGEADFENGQLRRTQLPLRHSRAHHGLDPERHDAFGPARLWRDIPRSSPTTCGLRFAWPRSWIFRCIFIYTHDSIGLGEDGPTHQPIEQLMSLRAIPRLLVFRPADANEVAETWRTIMPIKHQPVLLALTRQAVPTFDRTKYASAAGVAKGAYIMADSGRQAGGDPDGHRFGGAALRGRLRETHGEGVKARVVSMPCWELFEKQSAEYKNRCFQPEVRARVAVEAGTSLGWKEYVGNDGVVVARSDFGASAPIKELMKEFGFTVDNVIAKAKEVMDKVKA